jgi:hypothetical protein
MFDPDFGLPPGLQRGAVIPLSEGLYTLWTARNEVTFHRRHHNADSICGIFRSRLKLRLRAERTRLDRQRFADLWHDDWWWREHNGVIDILFLNLYTLHALLIGRHAVSSTSCQYGLNCWDKRVSPPVTLHSYLLIPFCFFSFVMFSVARCVVYYYDMICLYIVCDVILIMLIYVNFVFV